MPAPQFTSSKSLEALEWCVGVGLGRWFLPSTLHGERQTFVYIGTETEITSMIFSAVLLRDDGEQRTIAFQAPKAWVEKTQNVVQSCL
ncbi:hypothetical protein SAMN02927924_01659 [Sphingobium faniae]|nr:hypothetical protein SAMN02927924_01659 [Sphingobium faniae]